MPSFHVYMLRCDNNALYVGHTDDLPFRLAQHNAGTFGGYTADHRPVMLVWSAEMPSRHEAFVLERLLTRPLNKPLQPNSAPSL